LFFSLAIVAVSFTNLVIKIVLGISKCHKKREEKYKIETKEKVKETPPSLITNGTEL